MVRKSIENEDLPTNYNTEPYYQLLDLYFEQSKQILIKHHVDSYNQFIEEIIPSILQGGDNIISEKTSLPTHKKLQTR